MWASSFCLKAWCWYGKSKECHSDELNHEQQNDPGGSRNDYPLIMSPFIFGVSLLKSFLRSEVRSDVIVSIRKV